MLGFIPNPSKMENLRWVFILHLFFLLVELQRASCMGGLSLAQSYQQELDKVDELPGQTFNVSFEHYSGYVTVNEESGRALFYWFIEAVEDPSSKPLIIWLQGGPGCSGIAYGQSEEIGPFHIKADGKTLYLNPYSWNQVANIIFLESPVGVGFSYSNKSSEVQNNGDKRTAEDSLIFLLKWFKRFPQYIGKDFYITGESYAGREGFIKLLIQCSIKMCAHTKIHHIHTRGNGLHLGELIQPNEMILAILLFLDWLAQAIVKYQWLTGEKSINLKGYMVGNGLTDAFADHVGVFQFLWSAGLISDQTYKLLNLFCDFQPFVHPSNQCQKIMDITSEEMGNIDIYSIFTPACISNVSSSNRMLNRLLVGSISEEYDPCTLKHSTVYFNLPEVQKALHVNPAVAPSKWETCSRFIFDTWKDSPGSMLDIYRELIHLGLRIWVFSGNTDTVIPVTSTRYSIDALGLPTVGPWHAWYDDGQVGGWTQQYEGLTFVTVRGAGHEVPLHRPKLALSLIKAFLSGSQMPTLPEYSDS